MRRRLLAILVTVSSVLMGLAACQGQAIEVYNPSGVRAGGEHVDRLLKQAVADMKKTRPVLAGTAPEVRIEKVQVKRDAYDEVNRLFYKRGWTDGLPIVPPTKERVKEMLRGTDLAPDEIIGTMEPMMGQATVEKIAINAVMAGCRPEHLPIILAVVEAMVDPAFNLLGVQTTDESVTPLLIINGPVARQLEVNGSFGALGPGWQANASIGRAVRLVLNNIGGAWPDVMCPAGMAQPGRYTLCLAENEAQTPWPTLQVERGLSADTSTVTVMRAESVVNVTGGLAEIASVMGSLTSAMGARRGGKVAVALAPWVAQEVAAKGWSKDDVKRYLWENGRIPLDQWNKAWVEKGATNALPNWAAEAAKAGSVPVVKSPEDITLIVAGGHYSIPQHVYFPTWGEGYSVTKEIKLPSQWEDLLDKAK